MVAWLAGSGPGYPSCADYWPQCCAPAGPASTLRAGAASVFDLDSNCVTDIADDLVAEFVSGSRLGSTPATSRRATEGAETPLA